MPWSERWKACLPAPSDASVRIERLARSVGRWRQLSADIEAIEASVKKTGRCMIVHEATRTSGFGAELSALVQERCFYHLEAPIERVTGFDTPYPHSLEWAYFPGPVRIGEALKKVMKD